MEYRLNIILHKEIVVKVIAFLPAKGSSERVFCKNKQILNGEPLFLRSLKILLKCKLIDEVVFDTDSDEFIDTADYLPITIMKRDRSYATNKTDGHKLFMNEVNHYPDADIYVQLLCTSPFIKPETIDHGIKLLIDSKQHDSAILMKKDKMYVWESSDGSSTNESCTAENSIKCEPLYDKFHIPNSKDLPFTYIESMGLYIIKHDAAKSLSRRFGDNPLFIYGEPEEYIDINYPEDLKFAEIYAKGLLAEESNRFNLVKHFVTSAALSDLLDDMKIEKNEECGCVLSGFRCNIDNEKVMGRASTLKLRKLKANEDFRGIYKALDSYKRIASNDIIVVENEESQYAYFGDLNTRLAIRAGAVATVVNGATRDLSETIALNYPVFSKGYNAQDVRRRATTESINKPIKIEGHVITPKDLIFIDSCSMVVIYQKYEREVLDRVIKTFKNEKDIVSDILDNQDVNEICNNRGSF